MPFSQSINEQIICKFAGCCEASNVPTVVIAGGTGDAAKVTGKAINCVSSGSIAESLTLCLTYFAELADTKTISFAVEYQLSLDASSWATAVVLQASTVASTGATAVGTSYEDTVELALNLRNLTWSGGTGAGRYIRFNVTPDLSNTGTDTCAWTATAILGGFNQLPK